MSDITNLHPPAFRLLNKLQVSEFFNVSIKTVDLWVRRGCPYIQRGDLRTPWIFDLLQVLEWRFTRPKRVRVENPDELKPKDRRDWYEGERVREKVAELRANLITRDEFNAETTRIKSVLAECLDQLTDKLTVACGLSPAVAAVLRATLDRERAAMTMTS
jgi:phage terminase Nu1 subunit (DNA packaging protein)